MNYFEKLLEEKSKLENSYDYFTQWEYDKKLYEDVLLGIRDYYLNYTDHGKNHSETILTNILRMFGEEELKRLSSFDIWLLLEASYLHDCGMYISREEAEKTLKDEKFIFYFKEIYETPSHPMNKFTKAFKIAGDRIYYRDLEYELTLEYNMKFLISAYKRKSHAQDFKNVIFNKSKLLPERIYFILSIISRVHGEEFEEVMELPRKESGIGKEVGHPRFIACLLRMGDLLDIDNNRISPNVIKNIIDIIPSDSKFHLEKHRSISHLWIDKEKIEITATIDCGKESYEVAEITGKWFDCIRKEYNNQLYNWKLIIPNSFNGILPRLGELKIDIQDYEYIDSKYKPKFSVDTNNILELLTGTSIYDKKENALREILQNSMDATYLRVFEEKRTEISNQHEFSLGEIKKLFKDKEIEVSIEKNIEKSNENKKYNYWNIYIKDKGIGIDKEKLKYLIEAGSSYKDKTKLIKINDMPNWLKPSGNFGIGFQSIFLLTNKIRIESKSLYTQESIDVDLIKPSVEKQESGNIYFRKTKFNYKQEIGTKISFEYKTEKVSHSYSYGGKYSISYIDNFDPLTSEEFDVKIYKFIDEIVSINKYSFISIKLIKDKKIIKLDSETTVFEEEKIKKMEKFQIFFTSSDNDLAEKTSYLYKNQPVEFSNFNIDYFYGKINILGYSAKEVLQLNRNKIKKEFFSKKNMEDIIKSIYKNIEQKYLKKFATIDEITKKRVCYFYFYYEENLKKLFSEDIIFISKYKEELKKFFYEIDLEENLKIKELQEKEKIEIEIEKIEHSYKYRIEGSNILREKFDLVILELFKSQNYEFFLKNEGKIKKITLKKSNLNYNTIKMDYCIEKIIKKRFSIRKRSYIYCNDRTLKLRLNTPLAQTEVLEWIGYLDLLSNGEGIILYELILKENLVLFPFYMKDNETMVWNEKMRENYIKYCYENRADKKLGIKEFSLALDDFVKYLEEEFNKNKISVKKQ